MPDRDVRGDTTPPGRCPEVHNVLILENELALGGLEKKLYDFVSCLDRCHYRVSVCCLKSGGYFKDAFIALGAPFYDRILKTRFDPLVLPRLLRILRDEEIDLIYTVHHPNTLMLAHAAKLMGRVRHVVMSVHATGGPGGGRLFRPYVRPFLASVGRFIAVANAHKRYLVGTEHLAPEKIVVIHNGVALDRYRPDLPDTRLQNEFGIGRKTPVVVTVASLKRLKRIDLLIYAARAILPKHKDVRFIIVGDGPERKPLEALASRLGVGNHVVFAGMREDVNRILRLADVFVLPSRTEAFPNVILEAMASALPVVATDVGSVRELVEDGVTGYVVTPQDVDALRRAIGALLDDPDRARVFGTRAREVAETRYPLESMCRKRERLFAELLCEGEASG